MKLCLSNMPQNNFIWTWTHKDKVHFSHHKYGNKKKDNLRGKKNRNDNKFLFTSCKENCKPHQDPERKNNSINILQA